jgi:chemotaxis protein MotA
MTLIVVGLAIVVVSVLSGFMLERGQLAVLWQPAEVLIIVGCAAGSLLISSPGRQLRKLRGMIATLRKPLPHTAFFYLGVLRLMFVLLAVAQRMGYAALEPHVDEPGKSSIFAEHGELARDPEAFAFLCDCIRVVTAANIEADDLERLAALDIHIQRTGRNQPVRILQNIAEALPGLGIVAAVLGVVVTMQSLGGPASEIGHKVAAALVGTFLGVLLCYGVVGPVAFRLELLNRNKMELLEVLRAGLVAFRRGSSPFVSVEFARRSIPLDLRPSFAVMENELRRNTKLPEFPRPPVGDGA